MVHVHISDAPSESWREGVRLRLPKMSFSSGADPPSQTEILVAGRIDPETVGKLPRLAAVIVPFAGIPDSVRSTMKAHPQVPVYNLHHNASSTAEMAISLMMAVGRNLLALDQGLRRGDWAGRAIPDSVGTRTVSMAFEGATCLVIGYGAIGKRIARVCLAIGMRVEAIRRCVDSEDTDVRVRPASELRPALAHADVVQIACPLTNETRSMIGELELSLMKPGAILVNVARGEIVEERPLFEALRDGRIAGAGLDVWWNYPTTESPTVQPSQFDFASLPNIVMTPHLGGANQATETRRADALVDLLFRLQTGDQPKPVDLSAGY